MFKKTTTIIATLLAVWGVSIQAVVRQVRKTAPYLSRMTVNRAYLRVLRKNWTGGYAPPLKGNFEILGMVLLEAEKIHNEK